MGSDILFGGGLIFWGLFFWSNLGMVYFGGSKFVWCPFLWSKFGGTICGVKHAYCVQFLNILGVNF